MKHLFWLIPLMLLAVFGIDVLLTKGIIWIATGLFNVDWSDKFWMVFVALIIAQTLFGCARGSK